MAIICDRFDALGFSDPQRRFRLGILGGTFDPIHVGHLACAEQVRESFALDAVIFIPTAQPVFKRNQQIAPASDCFKMCHLATRSNPHFDVSALEINRGGDTYTVDTLRQLRDYYPENVELYFIAGADAIATITKWKDSTLLGSMAKFIGVTRPGFSIKPNQDERHNLEIAGISVDYLEITALAISSSDLRKRIGEGRSVRYLVLREVGDYIHSQKLYRYDDGGIHGINSSCKEK